MQYKIRIINNKVDELSLTYTDQLTAIRMAEDIAVKGIWVKAKNMDILIPPSQIKHVELTEES